MSAPRGYRVGARYTVERLANSGYMVLDPRGQRASEPIRFRAAAEQLAHELQVKADMAAKKGPRACLCCGTTFDSLGVHHRLCHHCRHRDAGEQSYGYALPRGRKSA